MAARALQPLLNTREAAALLGVSVETVRDYALAGTLPSVRLSPRTLRFRACDVEALMTPDGAEADHAA